MLGVSQESLCLRGRGGRKQHSTNSAWGQQTRRQEFGTHTKHNLEQHDNEWKAKPNLGETQQCIKSKIEIGSDMKLRKNTKSVILNSGDRVTRVTTCLSTKGLSCYWHCVFMFCWFCDWRRESTEHMFETCT